jgi:hypothetical protein
MLRTDRINVTPLNDPVTAVVAGMDTGNVDTVIIAGRVMKQGGRLLHVDWPAVMRMAELVVEGSDAVPDRVYFRAVRNIRKDEEVTWDYLSAESDISAPFECGCGAANCRGRIG